jgi:hypothetical protein
MKKNLLKIYITCFFILSNVMMFSQGDEDDNGDLEGNDPPPVPINNKMFMLLIVGVVYSYFVFKNTKKKI